MILSVHGLDVWPLCNIGERVVDSAGLPVQLLHLRDGVGLLRWLIGICVTWSPRHVLSVVAMESMHIILR